MTGFEDLLYKGKFNYVVDTLNDANNHMNTADYFDICEQVRADFLKQFDWSDKIFNDDYGVAMRRGMWKNPAPRHKGGLKKGDSYNVDMTLYNLKGRLFRMVFDIYGPAGNKVFETGTLDAFVDVTKNYIRTSIPQFFIDKLRNNK